MRPPLRAGSLAAALLALGAPAGAAHAAPTDQYVVYSTDVDSACRLWLTTDPTPPAFGDWVGVAALDYVVPANRPGDMPLVRCDIVTNSVWETMIDPVRVAGATATARPVVLGSGDGSVTPEFFNAATLCTGISDDNGTTWAETNCRPFTIVPVDDALNEPAAVLDPVVCPVTASLAPTINQLPPSVARVDAASGDVYAGGFRIYDCPPHGL